MAPDADARGGGLPPSPRATPSPIIPDELIDKMFDRELPVDHQRRIIAALAHDRARAEEVARTQRALSMLKAMSPTPDLSSPILATVERRRGFASSRLQRTVRAGRMGVAACVLVSLMGVAIFERANPGVLRLAAPSTPLSSVLSQGQLDAVRGAYEMSQALDAMKAQAAPIVEHFTIALGSPAGENQSGAWTCESLAEANPLVEPLSPGRLTSIMGLHHAGSDGQRRVTISARLEKSELAFIGDNVPSERRLRVSVRPTFQAGMIPLGVTPASTSITPWGSGRPGENPFVLPAGRTPPRVIIGLPVCPLGETDGLGLDDPMRP